MSGLFGGAFRDMYVCVLGLTHVTQFTALNLSFDQGRASCSTLSVSMPRPGLCPSHGRRSRALSVAKARLTKELQDHRTVDNVPINDARRLKKEQRLAEIEELLQLPIKERVSRGLAEG